MVLKLIISCEHAGNVVPHKYKTLFTTQKKELISHKGWDIGAFELAQTIAKHYEAPLFYEKTTRLLVEVNRSLGHPQLFSSITKPLDRKEKRYLLEKYYKPYRSEITDLIDFLITDGEQVLHISVHSFTPVLNGQIRKCDIGLLYDPARKHEKNFCSVWKETIHQTNNNLIIRKNYPYKGVCDSFTQTLRQRYPGKKYCGIEIEINQLYPLKEKKTWQKIKKEITTSLAPLLF